MGPLVRMVIASRLARKETFFTIREPYQYDRAASRVARSQSEQTRSHRNLLLFDEWTLLRPSNHRACSPSARRATLRELILRVARTCTAVVPCFAATRT